jgi:hypothetical protein
LAFHGSSLRDQSQSKEAEQSISCHEQSRR